MEVVNVADLANELGVPPSTLLDQCQKSSIEDAWAGTELTEFQQISLRSQLVDRNLVPRSERERVAHGTPTGSASLPPTVVGSLPGFVDQIVAPADADTGQGAGSFAGNDPRFHGQRPPADLGGVNVEHPTQEGWAAGDHDVACVSVLSRQGSLLVD